YQPSFDAPTFTLVPRGRRVTRAPVFGVSRTRPTSHVTSASPIAVVGAGFSAFSSAGFSSGADFAFESLSVFSDLSLLSATFVLSASGVSCAVYTTLYLLCSCGVCTADV